MPTDQRTSLESSHFKRNGEERQEASTVDRIMAPKDVHVLISRTYKNVTLQDKRDFAGVIKYLEMGRLSLIIWVSPM